MHATVLTLHVSVFSGTEKSLSVQIPNCLYFNFFCLVTFLYLKKKILRPKLRISSAVYFVCPDEGALYAGESGRSGGPGIPAGPCSPCPPPIPVWLQQATTGQIFSKSVSFFFN